MTTLPQNAKKRHMAADERRLTQIGTSCLSAFICVHLRPSILFTACAFVLASAAFAQPGQLLGPAQQSRMQDSNLKPALPGALAGVGIDQRLDQQVSLDLMFQDEAGRSVPLSTFFQRGKPVILVPVYYRCPMLCTQILNGLASSLKAVSLVPGKDFEIVAVSFDPKDTWQIAAAKKQTYLKRYGRVNTANGWHFLTGDEANIKALTDAVGYHYKYDPKTERVSEMVSQMADDYEERNGNGESF